MSTGPDQENDLNLFSSSFFSSLTFGVWSEKFWVFFFFFFFPPPPLFPFFFSLFIFSIFSLFFYFFPLSFFY